MVGWLAIGGWMLTRWARWSWWFLAAPFGAWGWAYLGAVFLQGTAFPNYGY